MMALGGFLKALSPFARARGSAAFGAAEDEEEDEGAQEQEDEEDEEERVSTLPRDGPGRD
jgi:ribosomal protein L12E/L44/L45/RPP1/RPP2